MELKSVFGADISGYMPSNQVKDQEEIYGANHYSRTRLVVYAAKGCRLLTHEGEFLDMMASYSAANQGYHHPRIVKAFQEALAANRISVLSGKVSTPSYTALLKKLAGDIVPQLGLRFFSKGNKALLKNGGVESVETAVKLACAYGAKMLNITDGWQEMIVFRNNFHGRTKTAISASSEKAYKRGFAPGNGFAWADFGDIESVKACVNEHTCAIMVEPMQGEGGMNVPPAGFLAGLRKIADRHNLILIFDEIQVGLGRSGKMFCFEHENVIPDVLILGKAISGGLIPVSACLAPSDLMDYIFVPGSEGSTYGGYPGACEAAIAALDVIVDENLAQKSALSGEYLIKSLRSICQGSAKVKDVRGKGLFIGVELNSGKANDFCKKLLDHKIFSIDSHEKTIRITPPLVISMDEMDYYLENFRSVLEKF